MTRFLIALTFILGTVLAAPNPNDVDGLIRAHDYAAAQTALAGALRAHPGSAKAHYLAALLSERVGDVEGLRAELQTAERLEPHMRFANRASLRYLEGRAGLRRPTSWWTGTLAGAALLCVALVGIVSVRRRRVRREFARRMAAASSYRPPPPFRTGVHPTGPRRPEDSDTLAGFMIASTLTHCSPSDTSSSSSTDSSSSSDGGSSFSSSDSGSSW